MSSVNDIKRHLADKVERHRAPDEGKKVGPTKKGLDNLHFDDRYKDIPEKRPVTRTNSTTVTRRSGLDKIPNVSIVPDEDFIDVMEEEYPHNSFGPNASRRHTKDGMDR